MRTVVQRLASRSLADGVADRIRGAIHDGSYAPGSRLVERRIAQQLGVSHIPVREALARLSDEGIVERLPRRGARVAKLTPQALEEISSLRIVLEQLVVRRAQERMTAGVERELRGITVQMSRAAQGGNVEALIELDQRFHSRLWELADHSLLNEVAGHVRGRISAFLWAATRSLPRQELQSHAGSHVTLLDAIASGDLLLAEQAMATHVAVAAHRVRATLDGDRQGA
jgi:DNA-binding GntR family transcriptional regulator